MHPIAEKWEEIKQIIKKEYAISDVSFKTWILPLKFHSVEDNDVKIVIPSDQSHIVDYLTNKYKIYFQVSISEMFDCDYTVSFLLEKDLEGNDNQKEEKIIYNINNSKANLNAKYNFDTFVVGSNNKFAHSAALAVAESPGEVYNPLFLYGDAGLGKTHLMHAIAWHIKQQDPTRNIVYLSAEKFMYKFVRALRYKDTTAFKEQFRSVDVLMVDDVQFMGGKDTTQEEFFYTFNSLIEEGRQIIISADKSPADLEGIETRLRSRLGCGLVADIHPTDFDLRIGILENKARQLGVELPQKVSEFLAQKITSNIRELEGALRRVVAHSQLLSDKEITLDMTQDVLKDMLRSYDKRTTIDEIQKKVAEYFNISVKEMQSSRRARTVARPRQIAMYLAKQLTSRSLPEIGRKFDRDHTTVMHAVRKVEELVLEDSSLAENVDTLRRILEA